MKRRWVTFNFIFCLRLWLNLGNLGGSRTWRGAKGGYKGGLLLSVLSRAGQDRCYVCEPSNQHKMMTIIVYRRLLKMKSVEDRIDQVSRQTICVISPDQRATSNRSMVSQILHLHMIVLNCIYCRPVCQSPGITWSESKAVVLPLMGCFCLSVWGSGQWW